MRRTRRCLTAGAYFTAACLTASLAAAPTSWAFEATAYQLNPAHNGYAPRLHIPAPLRQVWRVKFPGPVSYPVVSGGMVYVTAVANPTTTSRSTLYALSLATGHVRWKRGLGTVGQRTNLTLDGGRVFALTQTGVLRAFSARRGVLQWSAQMPGQYMFTSAPTASRGLVYVGGSGSGGTLYAVDEKSGALRWRRAVQNGDQSPPAVDARHVYVTYTGQYYAFDRRSGHLAWHLSRGLEGGGGKTPVLAGGHVYVRDLVLPGRILSISSGKPLGALPATTAPVIGHGVAFELVRSTLTAVSHSGFGHVLWTFAGDGHLQTAPLVLGSTVWMGSSLGRLYGISIRGPGRGVWSTDLHRPIYGPDEYATSEPLTGFAASAHTLLVPAYDQLVDLRSARG